MSGVVKRILHLVKRSAAGQWVVRRAILARLVVKTRSASLFDRGRRDRGIIHRARRRGPFNRLFRLSADGHPTFFGYYDKSPFDKHDRRILAMSMVAKADHDSRANRLPVRVGYFEWEEVVSGRGAFHAFGETSAWSWQQGCMLQWHGDGREPTAIYNRLAGEVYGSVVQDATTGKVLREVPFPLYSIEPCGRVGVSLNFSRLERLRPGYGYGCLPDGTAGSAAPDDDGIWLHDLETEESKLAVGLRALAGTRTCRSMVGAVHYVNHLQFSPDGSKVAFLHLWMPEGPRRNRLMLFDVERGSVSVLDDSATVSHFNWLSASQLIVFRVPFVGEAGYFVCDIGVGGAARLERLAGMELTVDGHPSLSPAGDRVVTDSYPDRFGEQGLYVFSLRQKKTTKLGAFYSPCRYRGFLRCDLHPRWDRTGSRICFDSTRDGRRAMYVVDAVRE